MTASPSTTASPAAAPRQPLPDTLAQHVRKLATDPAFPTGLPSPFYTDDTLLAHERDTVLGSGWTALAFGADVPKAGDVYPVDLARLPLLLLRDRGNNLKVFHNVCRHRGMKLVNQAGNAGRVIKCPYHAWCYSLDGALSATPHVGGPGVHETDGFEPSEFGLMPVRSGVWHDTVFINLDGKAPPLEDALAALRVRWAAFEGAQVVTEEGFGFSFELDTNWKLPIENYLEAYHLPTIHPALNAFSKLEDHYNIEGPGGIGGQGSTVCRPPMDDDGRRLPTLEGLPDDWMEKAEYVAVFPNVMFGIHRDHFYSVIATPVAPGKTLERARIYCFSEAGLSEDLKPLRQRTAEVWRSIFAEDVIAVEGMQAGRYSTAFDGGALTPVMDTPTRHFHTWMAQALLDNPGTSPTR